ncbi:MAG TPA: hypothetical protein VG937_14760 [Polyangiaceae bacterium]|nr:hypothetical protein [Polyangiaceae bacterium]
MSARPRRLRRALAVGSLAVFAIAALGCPSRGADAELERVEFGVLYGGDIQDREVIPLELDSARQELALRITFRKPLERERVVKWELERPAPQRGADGGTLFAAELGEIRAQAGERRAEAKIAFRRGDAPGAWRLSVRLDGRVVLERSFTVSEPERR